ncbi:hypothetical protein [Acinetobacter ursingii]|uniref:Internalin n=1 Tax=Acinetobacter ursingii TaxID=108980 RepID=A0A7T9Z668_9GAMM|nr:hypothetical protein [Acinetobacter ursingii]ECE6726415.1 internalin [Salmonella enterica subsp. enterica serovar Paratyphi A]ENX47904.1 hypothetical protein F943_02570 [Acinetobacter ursingii NIPH 706]MCU4522847.1 internalin [Acinetobacter ursingii]QQT85568.1 internalin [Acinetobacter ursingii]VTX93263.1 Uncharacterised protein [Acinetobacter ursingii]
MNKKLLICGVIATGLLLTACVKKEPPKEEEQEKVETTTQEQPQQPAEFKSLDSAETQQDIPTQVQVEREETPNTTTEVRREVSSTSAQGNTAAQETVKPEPKKETVKTESVKPTIEQTASTKSSSNNSSQSEDDAVAAAIAAATPALKN